MRKLWNKIKHWYWWKYKATDFDKVFYQTIVYGSGVMDKNGKFVDINKFFE